MNIYGGIDIGQKGGIAFIGDIPFRQKPIIILLESFPQKDTAGTLEFWINKQIPRDYLITQIYCVIEQPMKKLAGGIAGTYSKGISIGENVGKWKFWLDIHRIEWVEKHPKTWQAAFPEFLQKGGKERSFNAAIREIPECKELVVGSRGGIKDGLTDALLMAIFCKMLVKRNLLHKN